MKPTFPILLWFATMAAFGSWIGVMLNDDRPPHEYTSGEITPNPAQVGGRVLLKLKTTPSTRSCAGSVVRDLYDNKTGKHLATYDPTPSSIAVQRNTGEVNKTFILPDNLQGAKEIRYEGRVCFRCNTLQALFPETLCVRTPSVIFQVKDQ